MGRAAGGCGAFSVNSANLNPADRSPVVRYILKFAPVLYVKISPERLTVANLKDGKMFSEVPEAAICGPTKPIILGIGAEAKAAARAEPQSVVVNPFGHPRSMVSDFTVAEQLLKIAVRRVLGRTWFRPAPVMVLHPLGDPAGGFTQVERRAFRENGAGRRSGPGLYLDGTSADGPGGPERRAAALRRGMGIGRISGE